MNRVTWLLSFLTAEASPIIGSAAVGIATTVWVGIATFCLIHVAIAMVNSLGEAIVVSGRTLSRATLASLRAKEDPPDA